jgi:hypothetical protein
VTSSSGISLDVSLDVGLDVAGRKSRDLELLRGASGAGP